MRRGVLLVGVPLTVVLALGACAGPARTGGATTASTGTTSSSTGTATSGSATPAPSTSARHTTTPTTRNRTTSPHPSRTSPTPTTTRTTPTPVPGLPSSLLGRVVNRIPTTQHVVALTFDGGANDAGAAAILRTLRTQNVPATFFMTGDFANGSPAVAREMAALGRVGNHTVTHPHLNQLGDASVRSQVTGAEATIVRVTGERARPLFRFPFGEYTSRTLKLVNGLGYVAVGWTVDSLGWQGTEKGGTVDAVVSRVVAARTPGEIVLMHVGSNPDDHTTFDADALPRVIASLRSHGYGFVTLGALGI